MTTTTALTTRSRCPAGTSAGPSASATRCADRPDPGRQRCTSCSTSWRRPASRRSLACSVSTSAAARSSRSCPGHVLHIGTETPSRRSDEVGHALAAVVPRRGRRLPAREPPVAVRRASAASPARSSATTTRAIYNMAFDGDELAGVFDWDVAGPGSRWTTSRCTRGTPPCCTRTPTRADGRRAAHHRGRLRRPRPARPARPRAGHGSPRRPTASQPASARATRDAAARRDRRARGDPGPARVADRSAAGAARRARLTAGSLHAGGRCADTAAAAFLSTYGGSAVHAATSRMMRASRLIQTSSVTSTITDAKSGFLFDAPRRRPPCRAGARRRVRCRRTPRPSSRSLRGGCSAASTVTIEDEHRGVDHERDQDPDHGAARSSSSRSSRARRAATASRS